MRFTDCCSRCRVVQMTKHIIYVLQREYIFYCIVIIEKALIHPQTQPVGNSDRLGVVFYIHIKHSQRNV